MMNQAWLNGRRVDYQDLKIPAWDLGVVAGAAISDMARTYRHQPWRFGQHVQRLLDSCTELGFPVDFTKDILEDAASTLAQAHVKRLAPERDIGIVWFVTAGPNATYCGLDAQQRATVGIHTFDLPFALWEAGARHGVRLQTPETVRAPTDSLPLHRKTRNRLHWLLADRAAGQQEQGARALLTDPAGRITETSTAAFFAWIDNCIVTPDQHVLNSLSCEMVRQATKDCGVEFRRDQLTVADVPNMQAAFLSSTPCGLLPVYSINRNILPQTQLPSFLIDWWTEQTGVNPVDQILQCSRQR